MTSTKRTTAAGKLVVRAHSRSQPDVGSVSVSARPCGAAAVCFRKAIVTTPKSRRPPSCSPNRAGLFAGSLALTLGLSLCIPLASSSASAAPSESAPPASFASEFAAPSSEYLPSNRYWVAAGTGSPHQIRADIEAQAANGIGRITYNDLVLAQGYSPYQTFGGDAWSSKFREALLAGRDNDVQVDALIAPGWSAGSNRVTPDTDGSAKTLGRGESAPLAAGATFSGPIPLSELAPSATKRELQGLIAVKCDSGCAGDSVLLDRSSVIDLTDAVSGSDADGTGNGLSLEWTAPSAPADGEWLILSFFSQGSGLKPTAGLDSAFRGTVLVDHYGAAGAAALIDTWDEEVLDEELRGLLKANAGSMWLDSVELTEQSNWTPTLLTDFESRRGYSLVEGLPTIALGDAKFEYSDGSGERFRSDWMTTMSENFIENHLAPLKSWANGLGMTLRYQTYSSHGPAAFSASDAWKAVDVPESESEDSRAVATAAALQGQHVVPTECCAFIDFGNSSWRQQWPSMLYRMNQSLSTGSTLVEFHGFPEQNDGSEMTFFVAPNAWPGWTPFSPVTGIAEAWDTRQPSWHDQKAINEYLGRSQFVLRQGQLQSDFAVYAPDVNPMGEGPLGTGPSGTGYNWGYLSDSDLATQSVVDGVLAADGPRYRALVLNGQETLSLATADRLLEYARAGLPILVSGTAPSRAVSTPGARSQDAELAAKMNELLAFDNVSQTAESSTLAQELAASGVRPAAEISGDSQLQTLRRSTADTEFYFIFNAAQEKVNTTVGLVGDGLAYTLDAWTGDAHVAPLQSQGDGRVNVPVELAAGATTIIAVTRDPSASGFPAPPTDTFTASTAPLFVDAGQVYAKTATSEEIMATAASGESVTIAGQNAAPASYLDTWELTVEAWGKAEDGLTTAKTAVDPITVTATTDGALPNWQAIPGLEDVSGLGTYRTTVDLAADWSERHGATLDLGPNFHTVALSVNDQDIPVSQTSPIVDLNRVLHEGSNSIEVTVSTTLRNAILSQSPSQAGGSGTEKQSYGLTGPVTFTPYVAVKMSVAPVTPSASPTGSPVAPAPSTTSNPIDDPESTGGPVAAPGAPAPGGGLATTGASVAWGVALAALLAIAAGLTLHRTGRKSRSTS